MALWKVCGNPSLGKGLHIEMRTRSAAKSFGKFKPSFLAEIHAEILSHEKQQATGQPQQPVQGIVVHDSDVLEPEPARQGGLMRMDAVSTLVPLACKFS